MILLSYIILCGLTISVKLILQMPMWILLAVAILHVIIVKGTSLRLLLGQSAAFLLEESLMEVTVVLLTACLGKCKYYYHH